VSWALADAPRTVGAENRLRAALAAGRFAVTVELVSPERAHPLEEALAPALALARELAEDQRLTALSVTDRLRSDDDHDSVLVALRLAREAGTIPLVHLSGKDRTIEDLARQLGMLDAAGLRNILCVTGDRLKSPAADRSISYVDSVDAIRLARRLLPDALIAAGVSPFKYTEEATFGQYFKMQKKHAAGADCVVTQIGWDMDKLVELAEYRRQRALTTPVLVGAMPLSAGSARALRAGKVAGVVVTDDLVALAEHEAAAPDKGRGARLDRLALQIVGAERLGYAGVQLSGFSKADDVRRVLDQVDVWRERLPTPDAWWRQWEQSLRLPSGRVARTAPARSFFVFDAGCPGAAPASVSERWRYRALELTHRVAFTPGSPVHWLLRPLARLVPPDSRVASWLARVEHWIKSPVVGCRLCGDCRLPVTFYVCPETCPKGLVNAPCGGSAGNICEAGDRECIYARQYRLAKMAGCLDRLERTLVPARARRSGVSSWLEFFSGRASHLIEPPTSPEDAPPAQPPLVQRSSATEKSSASIPPGGTEPRRSA
jgi:methylenetetrahydrofolate reductase (NADH)